MESESFSWSDFWIQVGGQFGVAILVAVATVVMGYLIHRALMFETLRAQVISAIWGLPDVVYHAAQVEPSISELEKLVRTLGELGVKVQGDRGKRIEKFYEHAALSLSNAREREHHLQTVNRRDEVNIDLRDLKRQIGDNRADLEPTWKSYAPKFPPLISTLWRLLSDPAHRLWLKVKARLQRRS